ncbi:MAG: deoxyguanosinetriphosphate triphosphohydrolase [Bacteroidales bacterium]|nr:deoxyguanosinetriphosphate triphosphohydrolase [Bacteroidales bacterium]
MLSWKKLLSPIRTGESPSKSTIDYTRTNFQRDYDRLIFSSPFRRLQNKTQVFPLPGSVFVHNRLTHSLEVSSVGRSLGRSILNQIHPQKFDCPPQLIADIPTVVSAACLAHDLGNPPFGHSGEDAFRHFFSNHHIPELDSWEASDLLRFEGNANALRLLTHQFRGRRTGGFRLSYATLASIVKYPYPSTLKEKKFGYFKSEADVFNEIASQTGLIQISNGRYCRHPLVYLVEAADDICYQVMDIEDAHKLGILSTSTVTDLYLSFFDDETTSKKKDIRKTLTSVNDINERIAYLRAITISKLIEQCSSNFSKSYDQIMSGQPVKPLIDQMEGTSAKAMDEIRKVSVNQVYNHSKVVEIEIAGFTIIGELLDIFTSAVLEPTKPISKKALRLIPEQYLAESSDNYSKVMAVVDYISGMTDIYALETYQLFKGIKLPSL